MTMDASNPLHPTSQTLQAYSLGKLDGASAEAVNQHLEGCADCRRQVAEMAPDSFLDRLRGAQAGTEASALGGTQPETGTHDEPTLDPPTSDASAVLSDDSHTADRDGSVDPALPAGTRVGYFGDYELQRVLGEGGMGIVYKARQLSLNRPVALKMIKVARFASTDEVRRFQNEAEAVARLDHPNIVPIFEVGQFEDHHYFSMRLIAGESLDKRLKDFLTDPRRAARLVATIAVAIHHAHQRGILHRDLKPANILVDTQEHPHVTDFGLAKRVEGDSELTRSGAIVGTPAYMAPEQASAKAGWLRRRPTSTVWERSSTPCSLAGRRSVGRRFSIRWSRCASGLPSRRGNSTRGCRADLEVICLKCLEKDPHRRYASADALAEDLNRLLAGEPIAARPVGNAARFLMWCRRNPIVAGAAGLVAASLVAVAVLSLLYADRKSRLATTEKLRTNELTRHAEELAEDAAKISAQAKDLETQGQNLKTSLADSNRRVAMLFFERAQRAFDSGQVNHGLLWLVECWRYAAEADDRAWQQLARESLSFWRFKCPQIKGVFSHRATVNHVAFSPDGKTILTGDEGKMVRLWDATTGRPIGQPIMHQDYLRAVAYSPDGKTILTGGQDNMARLWDTATGRPIGQPMVHQDFVTSVLYSPDGKIVITGSYDRTSRLWSAGTGLPIGRAMVHHDHVISVAISSDGKAILTVDSRKTARLWRATSGQPIGNPLEPQGGVNVAAFSPDGKSVLTGGRDKRARLWNVASGLPIGNPMMHEAFVVSAEFSPDGKTIATGSFDMSARLWDASSGRPIGPPLNYDGLVKSRTLTYVTFSPDGKTLLVRCFRDNRVRLGNAATGLPIGKPLEHKGDVAAVAFSPDGKTIVTGSLDRARLWDAATGLPIGQPMVHQGNVDALVFSPDGGALLTGSTDNTARLWSLVTGLPMGEPLQLLDRADSAAFSPDGNKILTIGQGAGENVRLWHTATVLPVGQPMGDPDSLSSAAFILDGKTILTVSQSSKARLWDAATGLPIGQPITLGNTTTGEAVDLPPFRVVQASRFVIVSPDGKTILTATEKRKARLWNAGSGLPIMDQTDVISAAFSPDGKFLFTGGNDKTARLWDTSKGRLIGAPLEHKGTVWSVAFSPDGRTVLAGSDDRTARLWNTASRKPIGQPMLHSGTVHSVEFSPDGKTIRTRANEMMRLWDAASTQPIGKPIILQPGMHTVTFSPDNKTVLAANSDKGGAAVGCRHQPAHRSGTGA